VLDRSTRATGQPLAAARCVLIRELHLVACLCALPLPAGCHAAVEMTLADAWSVYRRINARVRIRSHPLFSRKKPPSVQCLLLMPTFFIEALLMPLDLGCLLSAHLVKCVADKKGRTKMHQDGKMLP